MSLDIVNLISPNIKEGYDFIPYADWCGTKGPRPAPYAQSQTYPDDHPLWTKAADSDRVGIRLNNLILIDYDGNKENAKGEIPDVAELATALGFTSSQSLFDECLIQWNDEMTSLHFFFIAPPEFNVTDFLQTTTVTKDTEHFWRHIDIKTGNQITYLKESKTTLLRAVDTYPQAPQIVMDQLKRKTVHVQTDFDATIKCSDHQIQLAEDWLHMALIELAEMGENTGRNAELNTIACTASGLVAGGALDNQAAHTLLFESAIKAGLERSETIATLESAWSAGFSTARRDAPYIKSNKPLSDIFAGHVVNDTNINVEDDAALTTAIESGELDASDPDIGMLHAHYTYFRENWVMNREGRFISRNTLADYNKTSFDVMYNDKMPVKTGSKSFKKHKPSEVFEASMPTVVSDTMYKPGDKQLFDYEGLKYLNSYIPYEPERPSSQEVAHVTITLLNHLNWLFKDKVHQSYILDWMAWNVQRPGDLIGWIPLIMGARGDGKSVLFELVTAAVGSRNAKMMTNNSINSSFQSWAVGSAVTAFEEIKIDAKDSRRIANDMKPFITEARVTVNIKNKAEQTVPNNTNYIAFSNESDPISIASGDRRWMILETEHFGKNSVTARTQTDMKAHFDAIKDLVNHKRFHPAVHHMLKEHVISDEFINHRFRAPQTTFSTALTEQTTTETEQRLQEYLDHAHFSDGRAGRIIDHVDGFKVQDFRPVMPDTWFNDGNKKPSPIRLGKYLRNLGYEHERRLCSDGTWAKTFKRVGV